jgi:hypothetical protein
MHDKKLNIFFYHRTYIMHNNAGLQKKVEFVTHPFTGLETLD